MTSEPRSPTLAILLDEQQDAAQRAERLLPLVYSQLKGAAQNCLKSERPGHTFQATELVHEAYLKLVGPRDIPWQNRAHFYAAAAEAMRRILIDHARSKQARGTTLQEGSRRALAIAGLESLKGDENPDGLLALDGALTRLEGVDSQASAVVRLRFFAGLDIEQTAASLGVSPRTVKRDWAFARGWLREDLERQGSS